MLRGQDITTTYDYAIAPLNQQRAMLKKHTAAQDDIAKKLNMLLGTLEGNKKRQRNHLDKVCDRVRCRSELTTCQIKQYTESISNKDKEVSIVYTVVVMAFNPF